MKVMAQLYELDVEAGRMIESFSFTVIALHQDNVDMECQPIKLKLFGNDTEGLEDYFESFLNLSLSDGFVFWDEKDPDYRAPLIKSLSTAPAI